MLNYVEGYGRRKKKVMRNFYEIAFGSLKESFYLFHLATKLNYITIKELKKIYGIKEEIAKMLWKTIAALDKQIDVT